jgi:hypothetical protein
MVLLPGNQRMKSCVMHISARHFKVADLCAVIEHDGELCPENPAMIAQAFARQWTHCPALALRMRQFDAIRIRYSKESGMG